MMFIAENTLLQNDPSKAGNQLAAAMILNIQKFIGVYYIPYGAQDVVGTNTG